MAHAITTRRGLNYNPPKNPLEKIHDTQNKTTENIFTKEGTPDSQKIINEISSYLIPFPRRLKKEKENEQFQKFFENLQRLSINILFIEALEQMPKYAKFMKDILTQRGRGNEASKITLNERCSAVVLNEIPPKEKDLGSFTIPCVIGQGGINKALADLGASISLMPYSMFLRLNLGELKPTHMFVFPVDFVVLDMKEDHKIPIILGRPFLATAHAMTDVLNKKISFKVGDETIIFDIEKSMRFPPSDDDTCHSVDIIDLSILNHVQEILHSEQDLEHESKGYIKSTIFAANVCEGEKPTTKLKDLPSHLEYSFLGNNLELPVIISSLLSAQEKESLLGVLAKHKNALAWKVADIKVQDVVKAEIVKLLDAGLIYAISESPWVSPIHIVPKKEE
ncbi:DNA-directed DNA polymerase [Tanacetum coccineum]